MIKPCGAGVIHPKLSLGGQECSRHGPHRVFGTHRRLLSRLHREATRAHRHQRSSYRDDLPSRPSVLQYCSSAGKTVAFDCVSEVLVIPSWPKWQFRQEVCFLWYVRSSYIVLKFRCSPDFYQCSIQRFRATHLDAQNELINGLIN